MEPALPETLQMQRESKNDWEHYAWTVSSDQMDSAGDKRKSINISYLDSSKTFHSIFRAKAVRCG